MKEESKKKKIGIAAGGTGGHLIPAEVISKQLLEQYEIFLLGHKVEKSPYLNDPTIKKIDVPAATLPRSLLSAFLFFRQTVEGFFSARKELKKEQPSLLLGFGSFYTFPVLLAAVSLKIPLVFFEANRVPGRIVSMFSRYALWVAVPYRDPVKKIHTIQEEVLFPLRDEFSVREHESKEKKPLTILVMGGSQGASFLNEQIPPALAIYAKEIGQVIHLCGKHGDPAVVSQMYASLGVNAHVMSYSTEVAKLMKSVDLAICRCGASTIAELEKSALPALMIPFPYAMDDHQAENAKYYCETRKGGWWIVQKEATPTILQELIGKIVTNPSLLETTRKHLIEKEGNAPTLATLIETTLNRHKTKRKKRYVNL